MLLKLNFSLFFFVLLSNLPMYLEVFLPIIQVSFIPFIQEHKNIFFLNLFIGIVVPSPILFHVSVVMLILLFCMVISHPAAEEQ